MEINHFIAQLQVDDYNIKHNIPINRSKESFREWERQQLLDIQKQARENTVEHLQALHPDADLQDLYYFVDEFVEWDVAVDRDIENKRVCLNVFSRLVNLNRLSHDKAVELLDWSF